jgi:hypothetical protein
LCPIVIVGRIVVKAIQPHTNRKERIILLKQIAAAIQFWTLVFKDLQARADVRRLSPRPVSAQKPL